MPHSSLKKTVPEIDENDIEAFLLFFETQEQWDRYRTLKWVVDLLLERKKVHSESPVSWLRQMFLRNSEFLVDNLSPQARGELRPAQRVSNALDLLNEVAPKLKGREYAEVQDLTNYLRGFLGGFRTIPFDTSQWRPKKPSRQRLRTED
jgi:hypothetical protein